MSVSISREAKIHVIREVQLSLLEQRGRTLKSMLKQSNSHFDDPTDSDYWTFQIEVVSELTTAIEECQIEVERLLSEK